MSDKKKQRERGRERERKRENTVTSLWTAVSSRRNRAINRQDNQKNHIANSRPAGERERVWRAKMFRRDVSREKAL